MIDFNCPQCSSAFSVPDNLAGRRARCKKCQTPITIPHANGHAIAAVQPPPGPRL